MGGCMLCFQSSFTMTQAFHTHAENVCHVAYTHMDARKRRMAGQKNMPAHPSIHPFIDLALSGTVLHCLYKCIQTGTKSTMPCTPKG
mmetsp:Transcript_15317/g.43756  ORF Transcript_15317/g.43756 Transcript_15317/m.43756 type:complete len:87 (+) Transcript_15317:2-262(+)